MNDNIVTRQAKITYKLIFVWGAVNEYPRLTDMDFQILTGDSNFEDEKCAAYTRP